MKVKIPKNVLGEEYLFYAYFDSNSKSMDCVVRQFLSDVDLKGKLSDDFTVITLETPIKLKGYGAPLTEGGLAGYGARKEKKISTFKIPKDRVKSLKFDILGMDEYIKVNKEK